MPFFILRMKWEIIKTVEQSTSTHYYSLSSNCTISWVADRHVRAMLYANLAVSLLWLAVGV